MIKTPLSVVRVAAFCLPLALVASCGSGSEAVQGTSVKFYPAELGSIQLDIESAGAYQFMQTFRVELRSPSGYPQIGAEVTIESPHALYLEANAVTCDPLTSVCTITPGATPLPHPYVTTTDSNGTAQVTVLFNLYSNQTGDVSIIQAWSGTGYNAVSIPVTCGDSDTTNTIECL